MKTKPIIFNTVLAALLLAGGLSVTVFGAGKPSSPHAKSAPPANRSQSKRDIVLHYDFRNGAAGWRAGFADYTRGQENTFELEAKIQPMPRELASGKAFFVQGHNRSDDLFMFLSRRLSRAEGIRPGQKYRVRYSLELASDAQSECAGIGGKPGESVYLKVGGASVEPKAVPATDNPSFLRMNVAIGEQSQGGLAATVIGNIANGIPCSDGPARFRSFHREGTHMGSIQANAKGELYLLIGTDSGFEGRTRLYYRRVQVILTPL
jgi:hypothetical protein